MLNGLNLGNLSRYTEAKSYAITAENFTGKKGCGGMATEGTGVLCARKLGQGHKISPSVIIKPGDTFTLADIEGCGAIQSMWFGGKVNSSYILRMYWDDCSYPAVECPISEFFAYGWQKNQDDDPFNGPFYQLSSLPVAVNPNKGLNCFWEMPFRKHAFITIENRSESDYVCYYQINYTITTVPEDSLYFHARYAQSKPMIPGVDHSILEISEAYGQYVGTALFVGLNGAGNWWGEGEVKVFIDGDGDFPTICGTGTEDYFGGSYDWEVDGKYVTYSTPFLGMHQIVYPDGLYTHQLRFSMYRWHIMDPIRFHEDLKITIQDLGWISTGNEYLQRRDDIASVAYWYQNLGGKIVGDLPAADEMIIV